MSNPSERPLFSQVGRDSGAATDPRSRTFHLVIVAGILLSAGLLLTELAERGRWVTVRVTLDGAALEPEGTPVEATATPVPPAPTPVEPPGASGAGE
ncbi:MAG: hypothetical protein Q8P41_03405 [Pseudomonadota bacterium]|nr:hypothetical protein [Pseudomonadota bacterium]